MQLNQKMMMSLAAIAVIMSVMFMGTNGQGKPNNCCTTVSKHKITLPITGFQYQKKNLPCVKAVIFNTTDGRRCSDSRMNWVKKKVEELTNIH
ncbi:C-C motif chemokine 4-like [Xyrauchen texanus]|uniref:C-C motif chemokine 4-like n=1 Tax=Xyrauchen texanus TaxID=154827 RepID=UPI002242591D|nr:C-C motif chemokine 4-like [Xyrauchen texanus]